MEREWLEKGEKMKIAVTTDGQSLESQVSPVFGRCPYFIIVETDEEEILSDEVLENSAMEQSSGAGTAAVQLIGDENVDTLIAGAVGPKAFKALKKWNIEVFRAEPGTVKTNVEKFLSGGLEEVDSATGPAGMGSGRGFGNEG